MFRSCSYTLLVVLTVDLLACGGDISITWTSPVLPKLYSNDSDINPLPRPITKDEESWIGSLINIGGILGALPAGYLLEKIGRKWTLLLIAIPYIISFLILAFVHQLVWYYTARFLTGVSLGAVMVLIPLYISEIAQDSNRGVLTASINVFFTLGNLLSYVLGPYLPLSWFNVVAACVPSVFFIVFAWIAPESPYYLVSKGQMELAVETLQRLHPGGSDPHKEVIQIKESLNLDRSRGFLDLFKTRASCKALYITLSIIVFQQFSGINVVVFYTELIFQESGSTLAPELSSIIVGLTLFLSSLILPVVADSFNRRFFLISSSLGASAALIAFGCYFQFAKDIEALTWLPIFSLVFFILCFNFGLGPLPWTLIGEIFPPDLKSFGATFISFTAWCLSFFITKFFNDLNAVLGHGGTFWLFGGCCVLCAGFVAVFVPETKGRSFKEIQELLEG